LIAGTLAGIGADAGGAELAVGQGLGGPADPLLGPRLAPSVRRQHPLNVHRSSEMLYVMDGSK
jgi:hypothetical protein